ncbi:MAG: acyl-CoA thioesterase [Deltaproteobacteria bacterium]|nr:acyl-CoA thioesterase [Deltaproteobacteria bacterium]
MEMKFVTKTRVEFRDLDAMRHVNNAVFVSFLETARMDFFDQTFGPDGFERFPFILGEVRIRFVSPAYIKEILELGIRVKEIGRKSYVFEYLIREEKTGRTVCEAESTQVMFDYRSRKTLDVPGEFRVLTEPVSRPDA